jgi:RNA polymerase sigma-70 factor (ECF subfamily)
MNRQGDFDKVFRLYYEPMYFFARHFVDEEETCRDLVMDVFEDLWRHRDGVKAVTAKSWLFVDLRNKCIDYLRRQNRARQYEVTAMLLNKVWTENTDPLEQQERERIVARRLDALPVTTRRIFEACYVEGKKYKEVAAEMGISVSTVKKHIVKALKSVKRQTKP